ncbi:hypothetical protein [Nocardia acididurans]|uniref:hypothetical protein n=1 Tax=Nocardia acididurans TaxID=2802282 RepID=UPI001E58D5EB|nr:hypothetical protein [Nocardia acididurans]
MDDFPLDIVLAVIALAVSMLAFVWEFVLVGRKRLGYRVQMDTPVTGEVESVYQGVLPQLRPSDGSAAPQLQDLSIVLVRIENSGWTDIDSSDYGGPEADRVGVHINFPGRRIIGMAVTELSDSGLIDSLRPGTGIGARDDTAHRMGVIDLPRVPLNRRDHYKILAILQRTGTGATVDPTVQAKIKGGRVTETSSRTGVSPKLLGLIAFLVLVIAVQVVVALRTEEPKYADCGGGTLTLVGSTAFAQVIGDAQVAYEKLCPAAKISLEFEKSQSGVVR